MRTRREFLAAAVAKLGSDKPVQSTAARRAGAKTKPSKLKISNRALQLIVSAEVTSPQVYMKRYQGAIWPKGQSGVTVGVGYDIGHTAPEQFWSDWKPYLPQETVDRLMIGCEATGQRRDAFGLFGSAPRSADEHYPQMRRTNMADRDGGADRAR